MCTLPTHNQSAYNIQLESYYLSSVCSLIPMLYSCYVLSCCGQQNIVASHQQPIRTSRGTSLEYIRLCGSRSWISFTFRHNIYYERGRTRGDRERDKERRARCAVYNIVYVCRHCTIIYSRYNGGFSMVAIVFSGPVRRYGAIFFSSAGHHHTPF